MSQASNNPQNTPKKEKKNKQDWKEQAKKLPCVFQNWAVFYQGQFQTVNLLDTAAVKRMLRR